MNESTKDAAIKASAMSLLWSLGYVVRPEVMLSEPRQRTVAHNAKYMDLTDIDVIGYQFGPLLRMDRIAVDCGSGKKRAAMERVFWMRGLMEAVGLSHGICVIGHNTEYEHRVASEKLSVTLISKDEFQALQIELLNRTQPTDLSQYYFENSSWLAWLNSQQSPFASFILRDNWVRDWDRLPVSLAAQVRRWEVRLRPERPEHLFCFFELAILLSIALVRMASYLLYTRPSDLPDATYRYVLGGDKRVGLLRSIMHKMSAINGTTDVDSGSADREPMSLTVPYFAELLDLTDRLMSRAGASRHVPRYLQAMQIARIAGSVEDFPRVLGSTPDQYSTKLALDVMRYLRVAGECNPDLLVGLAAI